MSLYGKYRPKTFDDVVSQESAVETLKQAVAQGKIAHAYLFAGARGTGKTSVARILAKSLLTKDIQDETLKQQIIKGVEEGSIVDLIEIDAASNRGIDDIRDLVEKIQFSPVVASAKVYIIDEVHMLTREAFNALLKTLEEPPAYAYFILATTELQKIPATIQSRCQRFAFHQIPDDAMAARLQYIADQEKMKIDADAIAAIARHAEGGLRDAISLLDQLRSLEHVTLNDVLERTGETSHAHLTTIFEALEKQDRNGIVNAVRSAEESGVSMEVLGRGLLKRLRASLHSAIESNAASDQITRSIDAVLKALRYVRTAPLPGLVLEAALVELCSAPVAPVTRLAAQATPPPAPSPAPAAPKVEQKPAPAAPKAEAPAPVKKETPAPSSSAPSGSLSLDSVLSSWHKIVDAAKPPSAKMSLKNARVVSVEGDTLTLGFSSQFHKERVQKDGIMSLEEQLRSMFGTKVKVLSIMDTAAAPVASAAPEEKDPVDLASAAADVF
jgi:DNA polymerase-3 subunit gamma/tau